MRGKVLPFGSLYRLNRITPAYAGKRLVEKSIYPINQDHPRLCGEKRGDKPSLSRTSGSPPPMRGKGTHLSKKRGVVRITPAYAGKSEAG